MNSARVIGLGAVASLGSTWPAIWAALLAGERRLSEAGTQYPGIALEARVSAVDGLDRRPNAADGVTGAASRLADQAARQAVAGIPDGARLEVYGGSTHGESDILCGRVRGDEREPPVRLPSFWRALVEDSIAARWLERPPSCGGVWTYSSCTSSLHALLLALLALRDDESRVDCALVLGVDALSLLGIAGFVQIGTATRTECRPFHLARRHVDGRGSGRHSDRREASRGTDETCRLLGLGTGCDAGHPTRPAEDGAGLEAAMRQALENSRIAPEDVSRHHPSWHRHVT